MLGVSWHIFCPCCIACTNIKDKAIYSAKRVDLPLKAVCGQQYWLKHFALDTKSFFLMFFWISSFSFIHFLSAYFPSFCWNFPSIPFHTFFAFNKYDYRSYGRFVLSFLWHESNILFKLCSIQAYFGSIILSSRYFCNFVDTWENLIEYLHMFQLRMHCIMYTI